MVKFHLAHTSPINPPSASPVLTHAQVWSGLQRKIRFAQEFVPIIESCTVLSDVDGVVDRKVVFKEGMAPKREARETVKGLGNAWVDFIQEDGTTVKNIISASGPGGDENLHMTYVFEFDFPQLEEGSEAANAQLEKVQGNARMAVEKSIETIREMVLDGRIKE
ncbi:DUF1857-domain-containing protein [Phaeosphaeriaceae sp. SRC1lsM3a]|nr:DUF1857-domain-containing protein [Stagonospora sp. SRC1lsM3a]